MIRKVFKTDDAQEMKAHVGEVGCCLRQQLYSTVYIQFTTCCGICIAALVA